ncbi:DUF885 domain-containing protein [Haliangium sp.]|uniref:DUF885 domain-containing protein n=1 Tax=Haliangium sp. TaxID=2663208 RepID=UPI003D13CFB5
MMSIRLTASVAAVVSLSLGQLGCVGEDGPACAPPAPAPAPMPAPAEVLAALDGLDFDDFIDQSYGAWTLRSPESMSASGQSQVLGLGEDQLDDISDPFVSDTEALVAGILELLRGYDRDALTPEQRLSYDVYEWSLAERVDRQRFRDYDYPIAPVIGSVYSDLFLFLRDLHPVTGSEDARSYITRLRAVPRKLAQAREGLRRRERAGVVAPRMLLERSLYDIRSVAQAQPWELPLYTSFADRMAAAGLPLGERAELLDQAEAAIACHVIPAYAALADEVERLAASAPFEHGVWQFDGGDEYYAQALRRHTTTDMSADEVHQLGLDELDRIHAEMRTHFEQLGYPPEDTLRANYDRLAQDSGVVAGAAAISAYEDIITAAEARLDEAFEVLPEADVIVIGDGGGGGFYVAGTPDGRRPGAFYAGTGASARYDMRSLTYHEAVPGHHLQIALAQELALPAMRRYTHHTAYVEGWALYAERLAADLGWYEDDLAGDLGRLQYEAFRAARLVVDTGLHAKRWDYTRAVDFMVDNVGYPRASMERQVIRYMSWPGQATAYKIGMNRIVSLRQEAMDALGDDFDLAGFHTVVLGHGSVPLEVLDGLVADWIEARVGATGLVAASRR